MSRTKIALACLALLVLAGAVVARFMLWTAVDEAVAGRPPELEAALRSSAEHDALTRAMQDGVYVLEPADHVFVLGCRHTSRPGDPQLVALERHFTSFRPDRVLIEGRLGLAWGGRDALVRRFGEAGLARALAWETGVPCRSLEAPFALEVADAIAEFGAEKVLAFYALRVFYGDRDAGRIEDGNVDSEAWRLLQKRARRTGISGAFSDLGQFDAFWKRACPKQDDWRTAPSQLLWRTRQGHWLGRIAERINRFRDRAMIAAIVEARDRGERVFAVCGSSHAILFEPALRAALADD